VAGVNPGRSGLNRKVTGAKSMPQQLFPRG
jgi:hypothetical protein